MAGGGEKLEANEILQATVGQLERLAWPELEEYGERQETVVSPSGRAFHIVSGAYRDAHAWASSVHIYAKAFPESGLRKWFPYTISVRHERAGDPAPEASADLTSGRLGRWN